MVERRWNDRCSTRVVLPTRFLFHAMLAVAIAIAVTGVALGAQGRFGERDAVGAFSHTAAASRASHPHARMEQMVAPPFPIAPRLGAAVAGSPVLSWRLEQGTDGARVELCPTSDFDPATSRRVDVEGEHVALPAPWPPGVWYWRLRGRDGATLGDRATPTWMLYVTEPAGPS
jgi:hypothetical protein